MFVALRRWKRLYVATFTKCAPSSASGKSGPPDDERYVAWFEPDHFIVERNAAFFVRRFTGMRWAILTPYASASWDGESLAIGPGASKRDALADDATEELWRTYFRNIFSPARLKAEGDARPRCRRNIGETCRRPRSFLEMIEGAEKAADDMIERMASQPAPHHAKVQAKYWSETGSQLSKAMAAAGGIPH